MPRVLVVDDSSTARQLLISILQENSEIEIVGQAATGAEGVRLAERLRPDLVTMDVHMPVMNGLEATREIMARCPTPIVIVSETSRIRDAEWAMQALQAGAITLLLKPTGPSSPGHAAACQELVETVVAMAGVKVVRRRVRMPAKAGAEEGPARSATTALRTRCVGIAASTGGPPAILRTLANLPAEFDAPVLIVQHIAATFTEGFAKWLNGEIGQTVKVAENREPLAERCVYIAPEDRHLGVTREGRVELSTAEPIGGFRPSATFLFESLGRAFRSRAVGVILTGMGCDGVDGLRSLRQQGGYVIAQDEATCVVHGMPGAAKEAGVVDLTLTLDSIGRAIARQTWS